MKILKFLSIALITISITSCNQGQNGKSSNKQIVTEIDSLSYSLGIQVGSNVNGTFDNVDNDLFMEGFISALDSAGVKKINEENAIKVVREYMDKHKAKIQAKQRAMQEKQMAAQQKEREQQQAEALKKAEVEHKDLKIAGEKFLEENKTKEGVVTTASGLQYIVVKAGTGEKPVETSRVKVHYHGTLTDGTVFDSSVDRGEPTQFGLNQVIKGWTEGLKLMPVGSKYKFFIPQDLGYGFSPRPGVIKPFETLVFDVELLEIVKPPVPVGAKK